MTRTTRAALALGMAMGAAALAAIPAGALAGARGASTHTVVLHEFRFHPATLNVRHGDTVKWLWRDEGTEHNVTFHGFHSRTQGAGSYSVRFLHRGTFNYRCTIHAAEGMRGRVVVH
jgi:plastocyanin